MQNFHKKIIFKHALAQIYAENESARFIFVLDEWDFIFHQAFITEEERFSEYFGRERDS